MAARKSIHQIESEAHRDLVIAPARAALRLQPLPLAAAANRTHTVFGFYPYWAPGFSELRFRDLTHLAVFSVEAAGSGQLVNLRGWPNAALIQAAHDANVRVVLVCTLFDADALDSLLSSAIAQETLIHNLVVQVAAGGADGINIDFEGVRGRQRDNLPGFMADLAFAIRAAVPGAHVSIDTPAVDWSGAFDYAALADICDSLMIMGYDYYWSGSAFAGPVAPLAGSSLWGDYSVQWTILDYLKKVGVQRSNKLLLGVPYYGYEWPVLANMTHAQTLGKATSRIYSDARSRADVFGRIWDSLSSTPWYADVSQTVHQGWYEDEESLSLKYDLVHQYGLQGIGIWALTYDRGRSALWDLIEQSFPPVTPPDPPELIAPATFFDPVGLPVSLRAPSGTPASAYEIAIGTSPGGTEVSDFKAVGLQEQVLLRGFSFAPGVTYYVTARSVGEQGVVGLPGPAVAVTLDLTRPPKRKYLPYWVSNGETYAGLALANATSSTQALLIRGYVAGRSEPVVASWVLGPGRQMARLLSEADVLGAAAEGKDGWLEVSCLEEGLPTMYLGGDTQVARALDGGPLLDAGASQVFPFLDDGRALIAVANPNAVAAGVKLRLRAGGAWNEATVTLPARSMLAKRIADLVPAAFTSQAPGPLEEAGTAQADFMLLESDQPVACSAMLERNQDSAIVPALHLPQARREAAFSYVLWGGGYETEAVLVNPSDGSLDVELSLSGTAAGVAVHRQLAPASALVLKLSEVFGSPGGGLTRGSVRVSVTVGSGILGSAWLRSTDYRIMAALPLEVPDTHFTFPQLAQGLGYWTGLSIANADSGVNRVTVEAHDAGGSLLGSWAADLAPGEQRVSLLYQWLPATLGVTAGWVEIRSAAPLLATEVFGAANLSFMAAVPGK